MISLLHAVAFAFYLLSALLFGISFSRGGRRLPSVAMAVLGVGVLAHVWALAAYTARWSELPLVGLGPSLSVLALLTGTGTLLVTTLGRARTVGLVLVPLVTVLLAAAWLVGVEPSGKAVEFRGVWFVLHVVLAFLGYVGLTVAFAAGLMYVLQFRELKSKRFGAIFRFFPPLDTLDRLGQWGILLGFPSLTAGLVLGWAWTSRFQQSFAPQNPQVIWGVITWFVFLVALLARAGSGRRGLRAAVASVAGFVVVVIAFLLLRSQTVQGGGFL